jgi:hypothetical protein
VTYGVRYGVSVVACDEVQHTRVALAQQRVDVAHNDAAAVLVSAD